MNQLYVAFMYRLIDKKCLIGLIACLFLITNLTIILFICFSSYQYKSTGPLLLNDPDFTFQTDVWKIGKQNGTQIQINQSSVFLSVQPSEKTRHISIFQTVPLNSQKYLRLSSEIKADHIVTGPVGWHGGRIILVPILGSGKEVYYYPHVASKVFNTGGWISVSKVFKIPPEIRSVRAGFQIIGLSGSLAVRNLRLVEVEETSAFKIAKYLLMAAWALFFLFGLLMLHRYSLLSYRTAGPIVIVIAILIGALTPNSMFRGGVGLLIDHSSLQTKLEKTISAPKQQDSPSLSSRIMDNGKRLLSNLPGGPSLENKIKKVGHFILFGLLFLGLGRAANGRLRFIQLLLVCTALAVVTEILQFFAEGRAPGLIDFSIDMVGVMTAVAGSYLFLGFRSVFRKTH